MTKLYFIIILAILVSCSPTKPSNIKGIYIYEDGIYLRVLNINIDSTFTYAEHFREANKIPAFTVGNWSMINKKELVLNSDYSRMPLLHIISTGNIAIENSVLQIKRYDLIKFENRYHWRVDSNEVDSIYLKIPWEDW